MNRTVVTNDDLTTPPPATRMCPTVRPVWAIRRGSVLVAHAWRNTPMGATPNGDDYLRLDEYAEDSKIRIRKSLVYPNIGTVPEAMVRTDKFTPSPIMVVYSRHFMQHLTESDHISSASMKPPYMISHFIRSAFFSKWCPHISGHDPFKDYKDVVFPPTRGRKRHRE